MSDNNMSSDLQALWDELTEPEEIQRECIRQQRFDERAKEYAALSVEEQNYADDEVYKLLTFRFGDEYYGIDVSIVTGVRPAEKITRVPGVPHFYRGVINIRGKIVSVLDLRAFFGLEPSSSPKSELILVNIKNLSLALIADYIEEVQIIARNTVQSIDVPYARGVTANRLVILDTDFLHLDERLIIGGKL